MLTADEDAACLWCDDPCGPDVLCPGCRAAHDHPPTACVVDPSHTPTLGPACATCTLEAERRVRIEAAHAPIVASLRAIRTQLIANWSESWPGCEFGKAMFGQMLDRAIAELDNHSS